ncbi:hypothetical protein HY732_01075 [Candidatus Uhrbacteria bacterium]|nr:hypothetical protein [Candidatus Uhrbacteria bacterium]
MKTCVQCKNEFQIFDEDREFYAKIKVPEPTWCPDCRNMRRCAVRNERVLYMRACDLCKKQTLSTHHADVPFPVYCTSCWWSDNWDALDYGREFDFSRHFFEQFSDLTNAVPHSALLAKNMENSPYCQDAEGLKDSYFAICTFFGRNFLYTYWIGWAEDLVDCNFILHSERLYECQDVQKSYGCRYVYNSYAMTDSSFCFACSDCVDCFMCANLRHKSYCIENVQYTKKEYHEKMKQYTLGSYSMREKLIKRFFDFVADYPRRYAFMRKTEDSVGDYLGECKDVYWGFDVFGQERGRYLYDAGLGKDCMDFLQFGLDCELDYEAHDGGWSYNAHFVTSAAYVMSCEYVFLVRDIQDCFGCFGLQKKQYCIFNKQYSKEEYENLRKRIIEHMKQTGEYGEFFPIQYSPYAYNETTAQQWYPKTKEEVLARGWKWRDDLPGKYDRPTIEWSAAPDDIKDAPDDIIKNIFACTKCAKNYRIIKQEFDFYKSRTIPLPRLCPDCRFYERFSHRNPRKLWHRQCMCELSHESHGGQRCLVEFETPYAPPEGRAILQRSEKVFCGYCYDRTIS